MSHGRTGTTGARRAGWGGAGWGPAPASELGPPPQAAGRSRRCPRRGSGARRPAATPRARGSRRPLPAYRAQLGPHGGAALRSLRRRRRDRRAPGQPPGCVTEEEGRARARPSRGAGAGGRARGPAPPRPLPSAGRGLEGEGPLEREAGRLRSRPGSLRRGSDPLCGLGWDAGGLWASFAIL